MEKIVYRILIVLGIEIGMHKVGVSSRDEFIKGIPARARLQLNALEANKDKRYQDGETFGVKFHRFNGISRAELEKRERAQKTNDILKYNRKNFGDNDWAAKKAREELWKREQQELQRRQQAQQQQQQQEQKKKQQQQQEQQKQQQQKREQQEKPEQQPKQQQQRAKISSTKMDSCDASKGFPDVLKR